jgi:hypothetical protein
MMSSSNTPVTAKRSGRDHEMDAASTLDRAIGIHRGFWWRFSKYEIQDGRIVPAKAARLQKYDPASLDPQPHSALFGLAWNLGLLERRLPEMSDISEDLILEWCNRYGLLGILPGRLLQMTLCPQWHFLQGTDILRPLRFTHIRTATGWRSSGRYCHNVVPSVAHEAEALTPKDLARCSKLTNIAAPEVILRDESSQGYLSGKPSDLGIFRFFGISQNEADTFQYPMPLSDEFWRSYGEPKSEFLNAVKLMARTLQNSQEHLRPTSSRHVKQERIDEAFGDLNFQLEGVHPFMSPINSDSKVRDGLTGNSLLQTIARLIQVDALSGLATLKCPNCPKWFFQGNERKIYCSDTCQKHFKVKAYRARKKEANAAKRADKPKQSKGLHEKQR